MNCQMSDICLLVLKFYRVKNKQLAFAVRIVKVWSLSPLPSIWPFRALEPIHYQYGKPKILYLGVTCLGLGY